MTSSFNQLIKDIQKKVFYPVYILHGKEPYYIDLVSNFMIDNVLDETEKAFNQVVVYGKDTPAAVLVDQCKRYPMMGQYQLVVLREAQDLELKKEEDQQLLISYVRNPSPTTILVMGFKYKSPAVKFFNAAKKEEKNVVLFDSKPKSENELPVWISELVKEKGYVINSKAINMLIEFLGNNLEKIDNELGKLFINHPKETQITEDVVEKNIGISKDYNVFELQRSISYRKAFKANQIVSYFAANPKENSIFKVLPMLFSYFNKILLLHSLEKKTPEAMRNIGIYDSNFAEYSQALRNYPPEKIHMIISWIREANTRSLGIDNYSVDEGELMKELIFKILH